jgi:RNA polymerase sigma factor (sigma-70 family)
VALPPEKVAQEAVVNVKYTEQDILDNMGLVYFVAKMVSGRLVNHVYCWDDLVSEGTFGLIKALDRFDPEQGFKFSSYGVNVIKGAMYRGARNSNRQHWNAHARGVKVTTFSMHRTFEDNDIMNELNDEGKGAAYSFDSAMTDAALRRLKKSLSPCQYQVADLMIRDGLNQSEIGQLLGLTRQAVNQRFVYVESKVKRIFAEDLTWRHLY